MSTSRIVGGPVEGRQGTHLPVVTDGHVHCQCGQRLVEAVDDTHVVVRGQRIPYRRITDHIGCDNCRYSYPVWVVRSVITAADDEEPQTPS